MDTNQAAKEEWRWVIINLDAIAQMPPGQEVYGPFPEAEAHAWLDRIKATGTRKQFEMFPIYTISALDRWVKDATPYAERT